MPSRAPAPILVAHLLAVVDERLIELLGSLTAAEWSTPTVVPLWTVKDIAAHLLDTHLRKLSMVRDGYVAEEVTIRSQAELAALVNRLNEEGVRMYRRLSPRVLISLMKTASGESAAFHESLDPFGMAAFGVSWAGETESLNWFDTARELTERWHHQQQIRLAVDKPGIMTPELYRPVLDCFLRGLPYRYRDVPATPGTSVQIDISGDCGGTWFLGREETGWTLMEKPEGRAAARVVIPEWIAWRVFTKGIDPNSAAALSTIEGDMKLGSVVLTMTSIVA